MKEQVRAKSDGHCWYCGVLTVDDPFSPTGFSMDHVVAKAHGGQQVTSNLVTSCRDCNTRKADRTVEEYRRHLQAVHQVKTYQFAYEKEGWS